MRLPFSSPRVQASQPCGGGGLQTVPEGPGPPVLSVRREGGKGGGPWMPGSTDSGGVGMHSHEVGGLAVFG